MTIKTYISYSRRFIGTSACLVACLFTSVASAGDFIYTLSGTADFSALDAREQAALKISAPYLSNVTITVYIDEATMDRNIDPEVGDYRPRRTDISLGGLRYSAPERSVRATIQAPLRNTNFSVWDRNITDSLNWQYNPSSRSTLNTLNQILVSLFVPGTTFRSDELRNLSDAQSLLDLRTIDPQLFIRTVKGNTYLMDMTDPEMSFEYQR